MCDSSPRRNRGIQLSVLPKDTSKLAGRLFLFSVEILYFKHECSKYQLPIFIEFWFDLTEDANPGLRIAKQTI